MTFDDVQTIIERATGVALTLDPDTIAELIALWHDQLTFRLGYDVAPVVAARKFLSENTDELIVVPYSEITEVRNVRTDTEIEFELPDERTPLRTTIFTAQNSVRRFPFGFNAVEVTGTWGFTEIPLDILYACGYALLNEQAMLTNGQAFNENVAGSMYVKRLEEADRRIEFAITNRVVLTPPEYQMTAIVRRYALSNFVGSTKLRRMLIPNKFQ